MPDTARSLYQAPADARLAASLLLLRGGEQTLEVLMLRRAERAGDMRSGAVVFPGGVLDPVDRAAHGHLSGLDDATASRWLKLAVGGLDFWVAALRECFEEVGLLPALAMGVPPPELESLAPWRERLQRGETSWQDFCARHGLAFDVSGMHYLSHWLTPPGHPKRFDTRFLVAKAPAGQRAIADLGEALELMWLTPADALARGRARDGSGLLLLPVTRRTLEELGRFEHADAALQHAAQASAAGRFAPLVMPRRASLRGKLHILLPEDAAYAEVAERDPDGRHDIAAELIAGVPARLSLRVWRVTAPNPGPMTGPGTNSYLVAAPAGEGQLRDFTVIDPGPAIEGHVQALLDAAAAEGGRIVRILVTHTHADHSPAAALLAAATGAPVFGRRAPFSQGQDAGFSPQAEPADGERFALGPAATLRAVHTPGHASNHLCWLLEEERLLFTGDHVMQGSTVVINPPDGDMAAYLRSLERLLAMDLRFLAPGHGFLVGDPHAAVRALIAHRLRREAKVVSALDAETGEASVAALVERAYDDVPAALHPLAQRSLLAHLIKLKAEGRVVSRGHGWALPASID
jgi:glyoxylase-like metal-dependent hydrolase (beta-lactamase superfamily II)/8-oxo-dGTP pyrophosphatase MutT (NUDIX family)